MSANPHEGGWPSGRLVMPSPFFLGPDDHLRVVSRNALAGVRLLVRGRLLNELGQVVPFEQVHTPNTDRTEAVTRIPTGPGWLLHVGVYLDAGTPLRGQAFVLVEVFHAVGAAGFPLATIISDYISEGLPLGWPGGFIRNSLEAPGAIRSVTGTNPAAGAEVSETVPTGARWKLRGFRVQLVTSATVASRQVGLLIDDGTTTLQLITSNIAQTASSTAQYTFIPGYPSVTLNIDTQYMLPMPREFALLAGYRIRTSTLSFQAGDDFAAPQLLVEEWLEP